VVPVFKDPQKYRSQTITLSSEYLTPRQIASIYEEICGGEVDLVEMGMEDFLAINQDEFPFGTIVWMK